MMNIARIFAAAAFCNVALFSLVGTASPEPTPKTKQSFPWSQPSGTSGKPQQQTQPQQQVESQQQTQRSKQGIDFTLEGCQKSSKGLLCSLSVTNASDFDRAVLIPSPAFVSIIDSEGNKYLGAGLRIANEPTRALLPPKVKAPLRILFQPSGTLADQIKLLEINLGGDSVIQFRDITIVSRSASQPRSVSQPTQSQNCSGALEATRRQLASAKNMQGVYFRQDDVSRQYPDYPDNRSQTYLFVMEGHQAASNVMNSPALLTDLAQNIISNCSDVGLVSFGPANSGWIERVGLINNDRVGVFQCVNTDLPGRRRYRSRLPRVSWGQQFCSD
jgi:hypothetical protein